MKTIKRTETFNAPADKVFDYLDDLGIAGMHMNQSSAMMLGSRLQLAYLTKQHRGLGTKYRWTGKMMGMKMDFTVVVSKWVEAVEKVWETTGNAKLLIYSWFRMHLLVYPSGDATQAELSITYEKPEGVLAKIVSFLFADWYCSWCLKKMLAAAKKEIVSEKMKLIKAAATSSTGNRHTNWYVITGGPGSGKTTTVHLLRDRGFSTTIEHARHYIDTQRISGRTVAEIREHQTAFQTGVLNMQIEQEAWLAPDEMVFLDRALPDSLAYYHFLNLPIDRQLTDALKNCSYKKIFILDILPLINDYARSEDEMAQKKIHALITAVYESLPFPVIHVPVLAPEERVDFILRNL